MLSRRTKSLIALLFMLVCALLVACDSSVATRTPAPQATSTSAPNEASTATMPVPLASATATLAPPTATAPQPTRTLAPPRSSPTPLRPTVPPTVPPAAGPTDSSASYDFKAIKHPDVALSPIANLEYEGHAAGINSSGLIVGEYNLHLGSPHGYLLSADGQTWTELNPLDQTTFSQANGINDAGLAVGVFDAHPPLDRFVGFIYSLADTKYITITLADGSIVGNAFGINNGGEIIGPGYILSADETISKIEYPGASDTTPMGLNNNGQVVGIFDARGSFDRHGFVRSADGNFTEIAYPNARETFVQGINDNGQIVGYYNGADGQHGFILAADGKTFSVINYPNSRTTSVYGINNSGQIVGGFIDYFGNGYGFG